MRAPVRESGALAGLRRGAVLNPAASSAVPGRGLSPITCLAARSWTQTAFEAAAWRVHGTRHGDVRVFRDARGALTGWIIAGRWTISLLDGLSGASGRCESALHDPDDLSDDQVEWRLLRGGDELHADPAEKSEH